MTEPSLKGRVALVTGGAAGIGRATCLALAAEGADIAVMDLAAEAAAETAELVTGHGVKSCAVATDVTDYDAVKAALAEVRAKLGDPLIVVCNAGIAGAANLFRNETKENWRRLFEVHVDGAYHCLRETINPMLEARWGRIVCTSSVAAVKGWRGAAGYAAAKAALLGLIRTLAVEGASRGVTANAVLPGVIQTALMEEGIRHVREQVVGTIPMGRIGEPEDIAGAVAYLCSERGGYVTGQLLSPNGGIWCP